MIDGPDSDNDTEEASSRYIACKACGARIRADRDACLRCGEPLEPAPETVSLSTISSGRPLLVTVAIAAGLVALFVVFWINRPTTVEEVGVPYNGPAGKIAPHAAPAIAPLANGTVPTTAADGSPAPTSGSGAGIGEAWVDATGVTQLSGDVQALEAQLEHTLQDDPNNAEAVNSLGQALLRTGDPSGATTRFERAVELMPDKWTYRFNLAYVLAQQGQWDRAVVEFRQAVRLAPANYGTQFDLAMALHKMGDDDSAISEYEQAIRLAPSETSPHVAMASSLEKVGRTADAQQEFQGYLDRDPSGVYASAVKAHLAALAARPSPSTGP
jgi:cytochrome c-type biogenesis protein CcmH/NrfG